jgi:hypothetical protein
MRTDGGMERRTDRHGEVNSRFFCNFVKASKTVFPLFQRRQLLLREL